MYLVASTRQTKDTIINTGSIPFSGKSIPPDMLSSQYTSPPNKSPFTTEFRALRRSWRDRLRKDKRLNKLSKIASIVPIWIHKLSPNSMASWPVNHTPRLARAERIRNMLCIRSIIKFGAWSVSRPTKIEKKRFHRKKCLALYPIRVLLTSSPPAFWFSCI